MTWPILGRLNRKNGRIFTQAIQGIIQSRMALAKDAKHDLYSIAADDVNTEEGLKRSELWAEAVFFLPAGKISPFCPSDPVLCRMSSYALLYPPNPNESSHPIVDKGDSLTKYRTHRWDYHISSSKCHFLLSLTIPCRLRPPRPRNPDQVHFGPRHSERRAAERIQISPRSDRREHAHVATVSRDILAGALFVSPRPVRGRWARNSTWYHRRGQPLLRYAQ